jgi:CHAD domain-containing protein
MQLEAKRVHKPIKKLRKIIKGISRQPSPEQVHDLRTNIRKLEALAAALSLDSKRNTKRLQKEVSRLRSRAGKVRDMDVLTAYAATLDPGADQNCKVQLLEYLGAKRRSSAKKLHAVAAKQAAALRRHLKRISDDLDRRLSGNHKNPTDRAAASAQATAAALRLQFEIATSPKRLGRQNLHPYRLKVKELRNVLRMAVEDRDNHFVEALGEVKDAIGEWHDWEELVGIAAEVLDHGSNCAFIRELKATAHEKYERALSDAESMRRKYLRVFSDRKKGSGKVHLIPASGA